MTKLCLDPPPKGGDRLGAEYICRENEDLDLIVELVDLLRSGSERLGNSGNEYDGIWAGFGKGGCKSLVIATLVSAE